MRNWIVISALGMAVAVGGLVYYFFPKLPNEQQEFAPNILVQPEQKNVNPLLTATNIQFGYWFPTHCQAELYLQPTESEHTKNVCVFQIKKRVEESTGFQLTTKDIFDPAVLKHWKTVKGVN